MRPTAPRVSTRDVRREQTRHRILGAAIAEFKRSGMAAADVGAIVTAAGVAHGTFYFHFPTKEHVLLELERREEGRIADKLLQFLDDQHRDLEATLIRTVQLVMELEEALGKTLCKEVLALHVSPSRPESDSWSDHRVVELLVREISRARKHRARCAGADIHPEVEVFYSAVFFLLGLYGVLTTANDECPRDTILTGLVATALRGLEAR